MISISHETPMIISQKLISQNIWHMRVRLHFLSIHLPELIHAETKSQSSYTGNAFHRFLVQTHIHTI